KAAIESRQLSLASDQLWTEECSGGLGCEWRAFGTPRRGLANRIPPFDGEDARRVVDSLKHHVVAFAHRRRAGRPHESTHDVADQKLARARTCREARREIDR